MEFRNKGIVTSVGYSFAFAALCGMALFPVPALADDVGDASGSSAAAAQAEDAGSSTSSSAKRAYDAPVANEKDETVYIFANPDGSVKSTEVSTSLKNPQGEGSLADSSELTDIENAESASTFTGSGDGMVWDAAGADVYYTGKTDKQAPVAVKVTYYLDGQKVSPDELAGASGKVKIRYDYINSATVKAKIKDKEETLYVPFTFVTALVFDNEHFKNAQVTNGKLIDDGDRSIIAGYAIPGLSKSLGGIVKDFDIPDHFSVEADVTDFEMNSSLTIATAGLVSDLNTDDIDVSELRDASSELRDAMGQILDGTGTLKDGLDKLAAGAHSAKKASGLLADGAGTLSDGAGKLAEGTDDLADGAGKLAKGAGDLAKGTGALSEGAGELADGTGDLAKGAGELAEGTGELAKGAGDLAKGTSELAKKVEESDMAGGIEALYKGSQGIKNGLGTLEGTEKDTAGSLYAAKNGADALAEGAGQLVDGSQRVIDAIGGEGDTGTDTLNGALNTAKALLASGKNEDLQKALELLKDAGDTLDSLSGDAADAASALTDLSGALGSIDTEALSQGIAQVVESTGAASGKLDEALGALEGAGGGAGLGGQSDARAIAEDAIDSIMVDNLDEDQKAALDSAKEAAMESVSGIPSGDEEVLEAQDDTAGAAALVQEAKGDVDAAGVAAGQVAAGLSSLDVSGTVSTVQAAAGSFQAAAEKLQEDAAPLKEIDPTVAVDYETARQVIEGVQSGLNTVKGSAGDTAGSLYAAKNGASQLEAGSKSLSSGLSDAISGIEGQLIPGMSQIIGGLKALLDSTPALMGGINQIDAGASALDEGASKVDEGASKLDEGAGKLDEGATALDKGAAKVDKGATALDEGATELGKGADTLDKGAGELADGAATLAEKMGEYDDGLAALPEGADAAADGAGQLLDGLSTFNEEGVGKITDIIDDDLLPFVDRLDAIKAAAEDYDNFAGITEGTSGSVKFVIETDPVTVEE